MAPTPSYFNLIHILIPDISKTWWWNTMKYCEIISTVKYCEILWNTVSLRYPKFYTYIFSKTFSSPYSDFPLFCHSHNKLFGCKNRLQLREVFSKMKRHICCFYHPYFLYHLSVIYLTRLSVSRIFRNLLHSLIFIFPFSDYFYTFIIKGNKQISFVAHQVKTCSLTCRLVK